MRVDEMGVGEVGLTLPTEVTKTKIYIDTMKCIWQSPSPGHPSAADEAWYWPKRVLRSG